jgi:hypothetical protein
MQQKAHRRGARGALRAPPSEFSASTEKIENADPKSVDDAQKLHQSFVAEIRIESEKIRESRCGSGELPSRRIIQLDPLAPRATPRAGDRG